jgi:hypothetical protein
MKLIGMLETLLLEKPKKKNIRLKELLKKSQIKKLMKKQNKRELQ